MDIANENIKLEEKLRHSSQRFDLLVQHTCERFIEININTGDCMIISPRENKKEKAKYKKRIELIAEDLIAEEEKEAFLAEFELNNLLKSLRRGGGEHIVVYTELREDGRHYLRIVNLLVKDSFDPDDEYIISFSQDITEIKRHEEENKQLIDLSKYESLTGLYTRAAAEKMVNDYMRQSDIVACGTLIVIDIDFFKNVNDSFGHIMGDYVLKFLARTMKNVFRSEDILCRWGGDEFMVFMKNITDEMVVESRAERLRIKMEDCKINGQVIPVTVSAGIAIAVGSSTLDEMFKKADEMLYKAKTGGRNHCVVTWAK
ncbi:MAG: GGDEF domain-containing protein [Hydrogenoanaerobacterium sp.]